MLHADDIVTFLVIGIIAFVIPGILTIWNLYNLCSKKTKATNTIALLTLIVGGIDYVMLLLVQFDPAGEWYEAIYSDQLHNMISGTYGISVAIPFVIGIIGLITLIFSEPEKLSPIISALAIASIIILNVIQIAFAMQISNQIIGNKSEELAVLLFLFYVYHFNILVISSIAVKKQIRYQLRFYETLPVTAVKNKLVNFLYSKIDSIYKYSGLVFICLLILVALMEIVFILIGQGADGPIKAFTDTADWKFSQQTPPPPMEYEGHYLCTVAAVGHSKVVKPLRYGMRRGQRIIVNRQLCIANAFEDYIQDKFPKFHRYIRGVYDKYGYPISKHITTKTRADVVYLLMKPLEWLFVGFLYLMDAKPEERIRKQYKINP